MQQSVCLVLQTSDYAVESILLHIFLSSNVQPLVIAAHPQEPNQFAVGLSDGGVHLFEPWSLMENGACLHPLRMGQQAMQQLSQLVLLQKKLPRDDPKSQPNDDIYRCRIC
ncbi:hypothetical protein S83_061574 [Arachis hypogaea]